METHPSYWITSEPGTTRPALSTDLETEVLVIGGGITGLTTAYLLSKEGVPVVLIELNRVASGTTGSTTGKVTSQHGIMYSKLARKHGPDVAAAYAQAQTAGLQRIA